MMMSDDPMISMKTTMKPRLSLLSLALTLLLLPLTPAPAQQSSDSIAISQAWSRATPGGAQVAGGYLTIKNNGPAADRLLGGSTDAAAKVEVHEMATKDGVMTMREVKDGVPVAPGATVKLAPGGFHLMLVNVKKPLKQGDVVNVTLNFEKAGQKQVSFNVLGVGAKGPDDSSAGSGGSMDHNKMKMEPGKMKM